MATTTTSAGMNSSPLPGKSTCTPATVRVSSSTWIFFTAPSRRTVPTSFAQAENIASHTGSMDSLFGGKVTILMVSYVGITTWAIVSSLPIILDPCTPKSAHSTFANFRVAGFGVSSTAIA
eukprot:4021037-Pyramimonas_sp.AAC.1